MVVVVALLALEVGDAPRTENRLKMIMQGIIKSRFKSKVRALSWRQHNWGLICKTSTGGTNL